jgi:hypothetical protein
MPSDSRSINRSKPEWTCRYSPFFEENEGALAPNIWIDNSNRRKLELDRVVDAGRTATTKAIGLQ